MTDDELVAQAIAELEPYTFSQQAQAELTLLRLLPVPVAAEALREELLTALTDAEAKRWGRYFALERALYRHRHGELPSQRVFPSLWAELDCGEEPEPVLWLRRINWWEGRVGEVYRAP